MKWKYKFTIFTPVYNRADVLYRVWDSIQSQTFRDFEWVVVDDGSSDNSVEVIREYEKKANFSGKSSYSGQEYGQA